MRCGEGELTGLVTSCRREVNEGKGHPCDSGLWPGRRWAHCRGKAGWLWILDLGQVKQEFIGPSISLTTF